MLKLWCHIFITNKMHISIAWLCDNLQCSDWLPFSAILRSFIRLLFPPLTGDRVPGSSGCWLVVENSPMSVVDLYTRCISPAVSWMFCLCLWIWMSLLRTLWWFRYGGEWVLGLFILYSPSNASCSPVSLPIPEFKKYNYCISYTVLRIRLPMNPDRVARLFRLI